MLKRFSADFTQRIVTCVFVWLTVLVIKVMYLDSHWWVKVNCFLSEPVELFSLIDPFLSEYLHQLSYESPTLLFSRP